VNKTEASIKRNLGEKAEMRKREKEFDEGET